MLQLKESFAAIFVFQNVQWTGPTWRGLQQQACQSSTGNFPQTRGETTYIQGRSQTWHTAPCNDVVSHGAQIGSIQVFANCTRKTNASTIFALSAMFQHMLSLCSDCSRRRWHMHLMDHGYFDYRKTRIPPIWAHTGIKMSSQAKLYWSKMEITNMSAQNKAKLIYQTTTFQTEHHPFYDRHCDAELPEEWMVQVLGFPLYICGCMDSNINEWSLGKWGKGEWEWEGDQFQNAQWTVPY